MNFSTLDPALPTLRGMLVCRDLLHAKLVVSLFVWLAGELLVLASSALLCVYVCLFVCLCSIRSKRHSEARGRF